MPYFHFSAYEEEWDVDDEHTRGRTAMRTGVQGILFLFPLIFQLINNTSRNKPQNEMQPPTMTTSREFVPNMWSITMIKC